MTIRKLADLTGALPRGRPLLGLDVGEKTIGLALSDITLMIASPLKTHRRAKFRADAAALLALIDAHRIAALVIGLPVNMDGSEGPRCQSVRQFAANLLERRALEIAFWDERLSTAAVTRTMLDADLSRRRQSQVVDSMAAAYILQGALDFLRHAGDNDEPSPPPA